MHKTLENLYIWWFAMGQKKIYKKYPKSLKKKIQDMVNRPKEYYMKYEHFTEDELHCPCCLKNKMDDDFMTIIEVIREELGLPMRVTSGYRCEDYNSILGGAKKSWHKKGRALDIERPDGVYTWKIAELAMKHGIRGIEIGTNHIHLDNGDRHEPVMFPGVSK